jgi:hypothetical protein
MRAGTADPRWLELCSGNGVLTTDYQAKHSGSWAMTWAQLY